MAQIKMLFVAVAVVFFGLVMPSCSALKCYTCSLCEDDEVGSKEPCNLGEDVCMKIALGEVHAKMCAYKGMCVDGDVEYDFTDTMKNRFVDYVSHLVNKDKENTRTQIVHCCKGDYCNAASAMVPATALLLMVPFVACLLLE